MIPQGIGHLKEVEAIIDESACDLPALVRDACRDLLAQIAEKTVRIDDRAKLAKVMAEETDTARRLQTLVMGSGLARMKCSGGAFQPEQGPEGRAWGH